MTGGAFSLVIVTPEGEVVQTTVEEVTAPGALGEFGVLPGHIPFMCLLGRGELAYRRGAEKKYLAVHQGYAEVGPEVVTILAELAEAAEKIDVPRAEAAKRRAEERLALRGPEAHEIDVERAQAALARALLRLRVASRR